MSLGTTLTLLSPELTLFLGAALVLALDLSLRGGARRAIVWVALAVPILAALLALAFLWGQQVALLSGMMVADPLALYFKLVAYGCAALVILGSPRYLSDRTDRPGEFYLLVLLATLAATLASAASDLISLYLAFEFLSLVSYVLVSFLRGDRRSSEGGLKYFLYGAVTSAIMLYGMSLLYGATGTTNLAAIAANLRGPASSLRWLAVPTAVLLLAGFSFKIAIAPFYQWAPDAYEGAPTPYTAFLSVASKMTGVAVLVRVMFVALGDFQPTWARVLGAFAIVSMILGNFVALQQANIKRLLAYSTVAHAGYIMVGVATAILAPRPFNGLNGVLFYGAAYLFTNVGVFLAVIAVEQASGSTTISDYAGMWRRSPVLAALMAYLLLSLTGIPFSAGAFAKFFVFASAIQAGSFGLLLAAIGILTSVVAAFYYLNIVRYMFFERSEAESPVIVNRSVKVALAIATAVTLIIGVYPQPLVQLASRSAVMLGMLF
jgi:NADH-quinone oxidoreductase subunit N